MCTFLATGAVRCVHQVHAGVCAGMHTHTNDVWIVVLKCTYRYKDEGGEKRVGPGDFIRVPGARKHSSGGGATEGALFYCHPSLIILTIGAKTRFRRCRSPESGNAS